MPASYENLAADGSVALSSLALQFLKKRRFGPLPLRRSNSFPDLGLSRLTDKARDESLKRVVCELLDLDNKNLGRIHLSVQKLDHSRQFDRDFVGDKNHANAARLKIALYPRPECDNVVLAPIFDGKRVSECLRRVLFWILNLAGSLKPSAQRFDGQYLAPLAA